MSLPASFHLNTASATYKGRTYTTTLLRRSFRQDGKVKKETVANLSSLPAPVLEGIRSLLAGKTVVPAEEAWAIRTSTPHGHVQAAQTALDRLGMDHLLSSVPCPEQRIILALIAQRLLQPASKLGSVSLWHETTLARTFGVEEVTSTEMYAALDWLGGRQARIEGKLAKRHLADGAPALYDLSSLHYHGEHCPLAQYGRPGRVPAGELQIEFGLLASRRGCPVAVQVFPGNQRDCATFVPQVRKVADQFGLKDVIFVGDRGMLTATNLKVLEAEHAQWVTALTSATLKPLVADKSLQVSLLDEQNLASVEHPEYPGERLIVCRNPLLQTRRRHRREELLAATETFLLSLQNRVKKGTLKGEAEIGLAVGKGIGKYHVAKHFTCTITATSLAFTRNAATVAKEEALDGIYVLRTNVPAATLGASEVVRTYKGLGRVEEGFRNLKTGALEVAPVFHRRPDRVEAHVFLAMLAYYVEWHLREVWEKFLFDEEQLEDRQATRNPVVPSEPGPSAEAKKGEERRESVAEDRPLSWRALWAKLGTQALNRIHFHHSPQEAEVDMITQLTPWQTRVHQALEKLPCRQKP